MSPFVEAVEKVLPLVEELKSLYGIEFFSIGGGILAAIIHATIGAVILLAIVNLFTRRSVR